MNEQIRLTEPTPAALAGQKRLFSHLFISQTKMSEIQILKHELVNGHSQRAMLYSRADILVIGHSHETH